MDRARTGLTGREAAAGDTRFIADLAQRMRWDAGMGRSQVSLPPRGLIASGTLDALVWVMDLSDLSPASGQIRRSRSPYLIEVEAELAERLRAAALAGSDDAFYLGGVADALDFVLGREQRFWWVPLPGILRRGRDEYGRAVA